MINFSKLCFTYNGRAPNASKYNFMSVFCKGYKVTEINKPAAAPNHLGSWVKPQCERRPSGK